ncbi:MAG: family 16 glycosylhydrolase [Bacteroidales bacterium]|nr:family 16 glycosylhydrolase [Bacteroidales bacterium]
MKIFYYTVVLCLVFFTTNIYSQPGNGAWKLVFEDGFDGTTLDQTKWGYNYSWGNTHNHRAYMDKEQVKVNGGTLKLTAIDKRHPSAPAGTDKYYDQFGYLSYDYTSGAVNTKGKFEFTYGYVEGRFKMSSTLGTWPAFWTLNASGEWPPEIDILEVPAARTNHHYYYHYGPDWQNEASFGGQHNGVDKSAGFHTYGVDWGPNYMDFYFDGNRVASYTGKSEAAQGKNMFLIINLAVGGWAGNPPAGATFPTTYECDYVKVWQKDLNATDNMDMEAGKLLQWGSWNNVQVTNDCSRNGSYGMKLSQSPSSSERLVEVEPNTTYVFGGWGKLASGTPSSMLGVKDFGGTGQLTATVSTTTWQNKEIVFTTGASTTTARLFYYQASGTGVSCADDFYLQKATVDCKGVVNGEAYLDYCGTCVGGTTGLSPCARAGFEAEQACAYDGVIEKTHAGYAGEAYLNIRNGIGNGLNFKLLRFAKGVDSIYMRYANGGTTNRNCALYVNGSIQQASINLPPTGSWTVWREVAIPINFLLGVNDIALESLTEDGAPNFDQIAFGSSLSVTDCIQKTITQNISLQKGWNLFSINVMPQSTTIATLFAGLDVLEIKNMDSFWRKNQPEYFNSLQSILPGEGYVVNMNTGGTLSIIGTPISFSNFQIPAFSNWILIGCPFQTETPFSDYFNATNCSVIKSFDGFWIPNSTNNSINSFKSGEAYFIKAK